MGPGTLTRRSLLAVLALSAPGLAACNQGGGADAALSASAARGGDRRTFVDSVAWTETDGVSAVVVFTPYKLTDEMRHAVIEAHSVYPALPTDEPVLEMRLEIRPGRTRKDLKISTSTLRSVQFTFWYFDDPTPVVRVEDKGEWPGSPEIEVVGLDGEMRKGGWIVGTVRARQIHRGSRQSDEAYLVNVSFTLSLF